MATESQNQTMVLSDEQQKAFDHYQLGENVFITGPGDGARENRASMRFNGNSCGAFGV
jgi:hypothetical protein